jgi:preprotein translocase subunit Sss1
MYNLIKMATLSPSNEEEVKEKLQEILSSEEFSEQGANGKSAFSSLRERLRDYIEELFERFNVSQNMENILSNAKMPPGMLSVIKIAAVLLLVGIIVLIIYLIVKNLKGSRKIKHDEDMVLINTIKDPDVLFQKVIEYQNAGDYNQALRYLYIALLVKLNRLNIIKINKSKTNKQYLMEIRQYKPEIFSDITEFTNDFNLYWYGCRKVEKIKLDIWLVKYDKWDKEELKGA